MRGKEMVVTGREGQGVKDGSEELARASVSIHISKLLNLA